MDIFDRIEILKSIDFSSLIHENSDDELSILKEYKDEIQIKSQNDLGGFMPFEKSMNSSASYFVKSIDIQKTFSDGLSEVLNNVK